MKKPYLKAVHGVWYLYEGAPWAEAPRLLVPFLTDQNGPSTSGGENVLSFVCKITVCRWPDKFFYVEDELERL